MKMQDDLISHLDELIHSILKKEYKSFSIDEYDLKENTVQSSLSFNLKTSWNEQYPIECWVSNNGFVDALFKSIISCLSCKNSECLSQIKFESFDVSSKLSPKEKEKIDLIVPTEKDAIAKLTVSNLKKEKFSFMSKSFSLTRATIDVVIKAIEFFVNAEIAYETLQKCLQDALKRHRTNLVETYTNQMSEIVKISCYSEIADKYKKQK